MAQASTLDEMTRHLGSRSGSVADRRDDVLLVEAVSRGEEEAFCALLERYQASLLRVARVYVSGQAVAEEVVQDTWMGFLSSLGRFEGRCSVKTWLFAILVRCAVRTRDRERRSIPFSAVGVDGGDRGGAAAEPERFFPSDHRWSGIWRLDRPEVVPTGWADVPEDRLLSQELRQVVDQAVAGLPTTQREVFTLRDIEGCTAEEVCTVLEVTANHQRVLLHRARACVRRELESYLRSS
jgi:RNA polymerase sigma-70 factor (ECF subfamily)